LLGPSHHVRLSGCGLTTCTQWETPLSNLTVDTETVRFLAQKEGFEMLKVSTEEDEHSLEMCIPYLRRITANW